MPTIPHPEQVQAIVDKMAHAGAEYFHVVADFDRTLTKAWVHGEMRSSLESLIEESPHLDKSFTAQKKKYFDTYYPIEMDPHISVEEKSIAMQERWHKVFDLLISAGLTKEMIRQAMQSDKIVLRSGCDTFFITLDAHHIPLLIFSASGLGYEGIYYVLEREQKLMSTTHIVSNIFIRDKTGRAIGVQEPIIHSFNKNETIIYTLPRYQEISQRKNILLLGDSLGDSHMADGFVYENILKVGFYNETDRSRIDAYTSAFDVVITDDGDMGYVNEVIERIIG